MPNDDLDRDKLYSTGPVDDDDGELELEPLDPELTAATERRAAEAIQAHRSTIDINEVYRDFDANLDSEFVTDWVSWLKNFRFQLTGKNLLLLTALVALVLAIKFTTGMTLSTMLIIAFMLGVLGVTLLLKLEENKRQEAADLRRQKIYAERRAHQARQNERTTEEEELGD